MYSIRRYLSLFTIGLLAYATVLTIGPTLIDTKLFKAWLDFYSLQSQISHVVIFFMTGLIIKKMLLMTGDYSEEQESGGGGKRLYYPPIRYLVLASLVLFTVIEPDFFYPFLYKNHLLEIIFLILGLSWGDWWSRSLLLINKIKILKKMFPSDENQISSSELPHCKFTEWLHSEIPINTFSDDKFNRKKLVKRIVGRLDDTSSETVGGQTIVGDFGSGKSSLMKLVECELEKNGKWIICHFDSWGRITSASQGQELILSKMIERISHVTGITSIKSIPKNYVNALNGLGAWWKNISSLLFVTDLEPQEQLKKIDEVLCALDMKLLVIIEDIDRNTNSEVLAQNISPLLDRLVKTNNVQFVFTIGYEAHISSVIHRITNYREDLLLHELQIDHILREFWIYCMADRFSENILFVDGVNKDNYWLLKDNFIYSPKGIKTRVALSTKDVYLALSHYLSNPRAAKFVLRRVAELWTNELVGEVEFNELLLMTTLKNQEPRAYEFIVMNKGMLTTLDKGNNRKYIQDSWKLEYVNYSSENHALSIVNYLFCNDILSEKNVNRSKNYLYQNIQANNCGHKYLNRLISGEIGDEERRDQELIKQLKIFAGLLENTPVEDITPSMIESAGCQFIIDDSYREEIIRFSFIIPDELEILAFAYLAFRVWELKEEDSESNTEAYSKIVEMIISKSTFFINELGDDKFTQLITDLLLPLMEDYLWRVVTWLETLGGKLKGGQLTEEHLLVIKSGLSKEFFMKFPANAIADLPLAEIGKFHFAGVPSFGSANEVFYQWLKDIEEASVEQYSCVIHRIFCVYDWARFELFREELGELLSSYRIKRLLIIQTDLRNSLKLKQREFSQETRDAVGFLSGIDDELNKIIKL